MQFPNQNLAAALLIVSSLAVGVTWAEADLCWDQFTGFPNLVSVAAGPGGVWAVGEDGAVYYRTDTYNNLWMPNQGNTWFKLAGQPMKQLDVGTNVWGVSPNGRVFYRYGMDPQSPSGMSWVQAGENMSHVAVDSVNNVWALDRVGAVFMRKDDGGWKVVPGLQLSVLDVGYSGVWGLDANGDVYYRNGTYRKVGEMGTGWTQIEGQQLSDVTAGGEDNYVYGADSDGNVYKWSADGGWQVIDHQSEGSVISLDMFLYSLYGLNEDGDILWTYAP